MAQLEGSETSVASSSPTPNWWEIHATPLSSWHSINRWQLHSHHYSTSSSCDEDNSTSADLSGGPCDSNLWTHVLLNAGGGGDMSQHHHNHDDDGNNFLEVLSSSTKSLPTEIFDPACDYLKKMDSSWEINNPPSFNNFNGSNLMEHERLTNLSDLVKNWSIAPPAANSQFDSLPCNVALNPMTAPYVNSHIKTELLQSINEGNSSSYMPYMHDIKMENQHHHHHHHQDIIGSSEPSSVMSQFINGSNGMGYQVSVSDNNNNNNNNNFENKFNSAIRSGSDVSWSGSSRSLSDFISFKPVQFRNCKQVSVKGSDHSSSQDLKKQGYDTSSSTKGSGRSTGTTNEGKKKRSDQDNSEALLKKSKHDNSSGSSSAKQLQVPKVKFADRISALQQIVSPFGKTDTASVLMEAINYIRFLQEQVQLLSDPYMKLNASKEHNSWGGMERKEKDKHDLRSRGLCLVPISCTPQAFRESTAPDYWTPTYRGCLFR